MEKQILNVLLEVQNNINDLQKDMKDVKTDVQLLKNDTGTLKTDVTDIKETVTRIETTQTEDVIALLKLINKKKMMIFHYLNNRFTQNDKRLFILENRENKLLFLNVACKRVFYFSKKQIPSTFPSCKISISANTIHNFFTSLPRYLAVIHIEKHWCYTLLG